MCVSEGKNHSFFEKFDVLCFLKEKKERKRKTIKKQSPSNRSGVFVAYFENIQNSFQCLPLRFYVHFAALKSTYLVREDREICFRETSGIRVWSKSNKVIESPV